MPRKGKGRKQKKKDSFGRALMKQHSSRGGDDQRRNVLPKTAAAGGVLESVLETNTLDDFLARAILSEREFESHKEHEIYILQEANDDILNNTNNIKNRSKFDFHNLKVPRRPIWNKNMTKQELDSLERDAFLQWRKDIATMEDAIMMASAKSIHNFNHNNNNIPDEALQYHSITPFEKNIEMWRQLWRVIEKSDILLQIVDARNPLFFMSSDLNKYVLDVGKQFKRKKLPIILINKSDLLSENQRQKWANYFQQNNWKCIFFSAKDEQDKIDLIAQNERDNIPNNNNINNNNNNNINNNNNNNINNMNNINNNTNSYHLVDKDELLIYLYRIANNNNILPHSSNNNRICIGMVGYPNVGKSSVINVLMGVSKFSHGIARVSVASTPGKTKHFQTLLLPNYDNLMLCDCPGLVFPSFVGTKADMICAGVYPISQMRNYLEPLKILCRRIPKHLFEVTYGIKINDNNDEFITPDILLNIYGNSRGLMASGGNGQVDGSRAARILLRDYVDGKLLFCFPPPNIEDEELINDFLNETINISLNRTRIAKRINDAKMKESSKKQKEIDQDNFHNDDIIINFNNNNNNNNNIDNNNNNNNNDIDNIDNNIDNIDDIDINNLDMNSLNLEDFGISIDDVTIDDINNNVNINDRIEDENIDYGRLGKKKKMRRKKRNERKNKKWANKHGATLNKIKR